MHYGFIKRRGRHSCARSDPADGERPYVDIQPLDESLKQQHQVNIILADTVDNRVTLSVVILVGVRLGQATRNMLHRVINQFALPPKTTRVLFSLGDAAYLLDAIRQAYLLFFDQPAFGVNEK